MVPRLRRNAGRTIYERVVRCDDSRRRHGMACRDGKGGVTQEVVVEDEAA